MVNSNSASLTTEAIRERKQNRIDAAHRTTTKFFVFVLFFMFAFPLTIVFSYYIFGWKIAVSFFPLLLITARLLRNLKRKPSSKKGASAYQGVIFWLGIFGIPLAAIMASELDWMRLWAVPVAILLYTIIVQSLPDEIKLIRKDPFALYAVPATLSILFVAGSEVVWNLGGFGAWVWYHAFFVQIFVVLAILAIKLMLPAELQENGAKVIQCKPPAARSKKVGERHSVTVKISDRTWHEYRAITLGQAQAMFGMSNTSPNDDMSPNMQINVDFGGSTSLRFVPENNLHGLIELHQPITTSLGLFRIPYRVMKANSVPVDLVVKLVELGWEEEWEMLETKLKPFTT